MSLICFSPCPHGIQNWFQTFAEFCQRILHSRRDFSVDLAVYKSAFLHCPELGSQNLLRYIAYGLFQFSEPLRSRHQITQNQHLPLIPDEGQRSLHGTGRKLIFCFCFNHFNSSKNIFSNFNKLKTRIIIQSFPPGNRPIVPCW